MSTYEATVTAAVIATLMASSVQNGSDQRWRSTSTKIGQWYRYSP